MIHKQVCHIYGITAYTRLFNVSKSNDYSRTALNHVISKKLFSKRSTFICNLCINHAEVLISWTIPSADVAQDKLDISPNPNDVVSGSHKDTEAENLLLELMDSVCTKLMAFNNKSPEINQKLMKLVSIIGNKFVGAVSQQNTRLYNHKIKTPI